MLHILGRPICSLVLSQRHSEVGYHITVQISHYNTLQYCVQYDTTLSIENCFLIVDIGWTNMHNLYGKKQRIILKVPYHGCISSIKDMYISTAAMPVSANIIETTVQSTSHSQVIMGCSIKMIKHFYKCRKIYLF